MSDEIHIAANEFDLETVSRYYYPLSAEHPLHVEHGTLVRLPKRNLNMHYALEIGFVLSGQMKRYYQNWHTELTAGQIWLCGIWEPHYFEITELSCQYIIFAILPEMLAMTQFPAMPFFDWLAPFVAPPQKRPYVKTERREVFLSLGRRVINVLTRKEETENIALRLLLLETILELCAGWSFQIRNRNVSMDNYTIINKTVEMVFKNRELITVHEAARVCGLRTSIFARLFKTVMGIGFADFSLRYRLNGAKEQLVHSQDPLKMIAKAWGFTDKSHFHHVFVQHYGCTPSEFRNRDSHRYSTRTYGEAIRRLNAE